MPQRILTDRDVVALMRKEFDRKLQGYCDANGIAYEAGDDEKKSKKKKKEKKPKDIIDPFTLESGLRVKHKDSQLVYTVTAMNLNNMEVTLQTGSGSMFKIPFSQLEQEYELD